MKSLSCLLIVVCLHGNAQDLYTVIKVSGKVVKQNNGQDLASGDKIQIYNSLSFNSPDDYIIVISPKSGSQLINGVPENKPYEFLNLLQTFTKPERKAPSAYRAISMSYVQELKAMLSSTILVLGDGRIVVDTDQLKLTRPACIMAQYRDDKLRHRKISDNSSFYLSRKALFGTDDVIVESTVALYYCEDESEDPLFGNSTLIGSIMPVYTDEVALLKEMKTLIEVLVESGNTHDQLMQEIRNYLELGYARVIDQNLKAWLNSNRLLKK